MDPVDEAQETGADSWSVHLPGPETVPTYLVSKFAAQYRVVVEVLLAGQDTSLTGMSFDEISRAVRAQVQERLDASVVPGLLAEGAFNLDARLAKLESWQAVTRWQEPARTGEDFLRRRDRHQLTPLARALGDRGDPGSRRWRTRATHPGDGATAPAPRSTGRARSSGVG